MNLNLSSSDSQKFLIQLPSFFEDYIEDYTMDRWKEEVALIKSSGFECIENASEEHLRHLGGILDRFSEKFCIPIEPFNIFLTKVISQIHSYPLSHKTIKKLKDSTLLDQMNQLIETIKNVTKIFLDWQFSLHEDINLYKTFIPSPEESFKKTTNLKEDYEKIQLTLQKIIKVKEALLKEIEIRIKDDINHKSSIESLALISSSHHTTPDKLNQDSKLYHSLTDSLNEISKKDIKSEQKKLDESKASFEYSFNLLTYLITQNLLCTSTNEKSFKRWYNAGWYNYLNAKGTEALKYPSFQSNFDKMRSTLLEDIESSVEEIQLSNEDFFQVLEKPIVPSIPIEIANQEKIFDGEFEENDASSFKNEYLEEFAVYLSLSDKI